MREPREGEEREERVLEACFQCLVKKGIEQASIKEFTKATGMVISSLYYWFENKDEIVLDAVSWGLHENIKRLFDYAFEHTDNLQTLCRGLSEISKKRKNELRLIFQLVTSPKYGEHIRSHIDEMNRIYCDYTIALSKKLYMDFDKLFPYVNLFIAAIVEAVMWDSWDRLDMEMSFIVDSILKEEQRAN